MNGDNSQQPDPNQAQSPWQYHPDAPDPETGLGQELVGVPNGQYVPQNQEMTWSASEFIAHDKDSRWYGLFGLAVVGIAAIVYLITRDIFSVVVILGLAGLVAYTAGRKPQIITYQLDTHGLTMAGKFHPYSEYRSFSIIQEGAFSSILLSPLKRFAVPVNLYYEPKDEEPIVAVISQHLPVEHREHDPIDKLTRRIRF